MLLINYLFKHFLELQSPKIYLFILGPYNIEYSTTLYNRKRVRFQKKGACYQTNGLLLVYQVPKGQETY